MGELQAHIRISSDINVKYALLPETLSDGHSQALDRCS